MRPAAHQRSRRALPAALLAAAVIAGLSCSDKSDIGPGGIADVRVTPDTLHVLLGRASKAVAFPIDNEHAFVPHKQITWATTDPAIATVDDTGAVSGNALGTTDITATVGSVTGTATVIVDPAPTISFLNDTARITAIAGSGTLAGISDTILNAGGGAITGLTIDSISYAAAPTGWLQAALGSTTAPAGINLGATPTTVPLGTHLALVWLSSPDASPLTRALPVVLTATTDVPASIARQSANGQTATVNTAVPAAPSVLVKDQFNNPVAGVTVTFTPTPGSGAVVGGSALTDASGIATVTSWTLGTTAGPNVVNATLAGVPGSPVVFTATGTAGAAANLGIGAGNNQAAVAGTPVAAAPAALVTDAFGNAVSGVTVTFAVTSGGGSITGGTPASNASGVAAIGTWTLGAIAGANTLSATAAGLTGSPLTFTATGNPGNATTIALISGNNQSGTVNTALAAAFVVKVTDINGNPVQGVTVGWGPVAGGGSMNPASSITDAGGLASSTRTLGTGAGTQTAAGTSAGLTGSPVGFTATANPGAVTTLVVNLGNNQTATVNTAVATAPSVVARDAFSNPVPGAAVSFAVATGAGTVNCGAGNLSNCSINTNASGIASLSSWILGTTAGSNTLSVTRPLATGTSFSATGTAGPAASIAITSSNSQTARPGSSVPAPAVLVTDAFGNAVPGVNVTFTVTGGNGSVNCSLFQVLGPSCVSTTNASGNASAFSWAMGSTGLPTVATPANGRYTNTLDATAGAAPAATFTGFGAWSYSADVQPILDVGCTGCHFAGGTVPNLTVYGGFRSVSIGTACGAFTQYVLAGFNTLGSSFLFNKVNSGAPCRGSQMPPGGPFLNTTQQNIIRDWINNSSPNN